MQSSSKYPMFDSPKIDAVVKVDNNTRGLDPKTFPGSSTLKSLFVNWILGSENK